MSQRVGEQPEDRPVDLPPAQRRGHEPAPDDTLTFTLTTRQLFGIRATAGGLMAALVVVCAVLGAQWPKIAAHDTLIEENFALKERVRQIDEQLRDAEDAMMRLKLYQAQLASLSEAQGDHGGPLHEGDFSGYPMLDGWHATEQLDTDGSDTDVPAHEPHDELYAADGGIEVGLEGPVEGGTLRLPAVGWAEDVAQRLEDFLLNFQSDEPDLNLLMSELESLRALNNALPGIWPSKGRLTSAFGWRRDPYRRHTKFHSGIDIANARGTPVHAVAPGVVSEARTMSGYGRVVVIDHGFGITTTYAHCTRLLVKKGDRVERGDYIATMGSTGRSTGPHLHFELRAGDSALDPLKYLPR